MPSLEPMIVEESTARVCVGILEDDPTMGGSLSQRLVIEGYKPVWWKSAGDALKAFEHELPDIMVCDIRLPDMSGEDFYRRVVTIPGSPPFIFITGFGDIEQAVRLMRLGAKDYITKPFAMDEFLTRVGQSTRPRADEKATGTGVLGISPEMEQVETLLRRYASIDLPVLIQGETGVGKEVAAKYLHGCSPSSGGPFMTVNCAAIPPELLESEIFGHERGAFTGAVRQHAGYAERAAGGTLFLDEVGDMPSSLQAKILRLIEDRGFFRVGGEKRIELQARVVAATHRDLPACCTQGVFREDLYFRLSALPVELEPLRNRPTDLVWLMNKFVLGAIERQDRDVRGVSALAEEFVLDHDWRGNARELRNRVERAVAVSTGDLIMPHDLFPDQHVRPNDQGGQFVSLAQVRDSAERRQIDRALAQTGGHIQKSANLLGISRTTLWEKMTKYGIGPKRPES